MSLAMTVLLFAVSVVVGVLAVPGLLFVAAPSLPSSARGAAARIIVTMMNLTSNGMALYQRKTDDYDLLPVADPATVANAEAKTHLYDGQEDVYVEVDDTKGWSRLGKAPFGVTWEKKPEAMDEELKDEPEESREYKYDSLGNDEPDVVADTPDDAEPLSPDEPVEATSDPFEVVDEDEDTAAESETDGGRRVSDGGYELLGRTRAGKTLATAKQLPADGYVVDVYRVMKRLEGAAAGHVAGDTERWAMKEYGGDSTMSTKWVAIGMVICLLSGSFTAMIAL